MLLGELWLAFELDAESLLAVVPASASVDLHGRLRRLTVVHRLPRHGVSGQRDRASQSPHQPAVEPVEELSDVGPLVIVTPTTQEGVDLLSTG
jgi:hypothetical protein